MASSVILSWLSTWGWSHGTDTSVSGSKHGKAHRNITTTNSAPAWRRMWFDTPRPHRCPAVPQHGRGRRCAPPCPTEPLQVTRMPRTSPPMWSATACASVETCPCTQQAGLVLVLTLWLLGLKHTHANRVSIMVCWVCADDHSGHSCDRCSRDNLKCWGSAGGFPGTVEECSCRAPTECRRCNPASSTCRTCRTTFASRNALFRHLQTNMAHVVAVRCHCH